MPLAHLASRSVGHWPGVSIPTHLPHSIPTGSCPEQPCPEVTVSSASEHEESAGGVWVPPATSFLVPCRRGKWPRKGRGTQGSQQQVGAPSLQVAQERLSALQTPWHQPTCCPMPTHRGFSARSAPKPSAPTVARAVDSWKGTPKEGPGSPSPGQPSALRESWQHPCRNLLRQQSAALAAAAASVQLLQLFAQPRAPEHRPQPPTGAPGWHLPQGPNHPAS